MTKFLVTIQKTYICELVIEAVSKTAIRKAFNTGKIQTSLFNVENGDFIDWSDLQIDEQLISDPADYVLKGE